MPVVFKDGSYTWQKEPKVRQPPPMTAVLAKIRRDKRARPKSEDIATLRAMPYGEYLKSAHWRKKRKAAFRHYGVQCEICHSQQSLQIHHRNYKRLGREKMGDLQILCSGCHENTHEGEKPGCFDPMTREFMEILS